MTLAQIAAGSRLLRGRKLNLIIVGDLYSVCQPVEEPWLAAILADHTSRQSIEHRVLEEGVFGAG